MTDQILSFAHAVLPENGEDCFIVLQKPECTALCVADGCGGLGSRRYPGLKNHTGAYAASRLAVHVFRQWAENKADRARGCELEQALESAFRKVADRESSVQGSRIVGSMQRRLPTTFCAALVGKDKADFLWAGDTRAYVLDEQGLHQCTGDHLKGTPDPFENLYRDMPLSSYVSADTPVRLSRKSLPLRAPCAVLLASDGAYGPLATPMEFEMLLLDALKAASGWKDWQKKLKKACAAAAQDDATLVVCLHETGQYEAFRSRMMLRREALQKQFITPVRRKKGNLAFARERWQIYRQTYDWTEEESHG